MAIVKNLMVRAGADFSALRKGMIDAQKQVESFKNGITKSMAGAAAALAGLGVGFALGDAIRESVKVEGAIQSLNLLLKENAAEFQKWANTQALAYGMSKGEALDYGRTFAIMTKSFASNTQQQMNYSIELLRTASVVASKSGQTMQEVMERIASGLRGETESIQNLGIFTEVAMLESTKAFKQFAGSKSWNQLSIQTQAQIRYFAILEQAANIYGTTLEQNTGTRINQFTASLKNLQLALGNAFTPILNVILPSLTAFVQKIAQAMEYVAAFSKALFGQKEAKNGSKAVDQVASSVSDTTDNLNDAAKAQKGFLAGFDEVNAIPTAQGASAAAAPTALAPAPMTSGGVSTAIQDEMTNVTAKAEEMATKVRSAFETVQTVIAEAVPYVTAALAGLGVAFGAYYLQVNGANIITKAATLSMSLFSNGLLIARGAMAAFSAGLALLTSPIGLIVAAIAAVTAACVYFYQTNASFRGVVDTVFKDILNVLKSLWINVLQPIAKFLYEVWLVVWDAIKIAFTALKPVISALGTAVSYLWKNVLAPFILWSSRTLAQTFTTIFEGIGSAIKGSIEAFKGFVKFIKGVFYNDNKLAWEGVRDMIAGLFNGLVSIVKTPINVVIGMVNSLIDGINGLTGLPEWMTGGKKFLSIPNIPKLARGGIVDSPTLAMVGEAGKELIMPLENTGFVDKLAGALGTAVLSAMQVGQTNTNRQSGDVVLKIDGNTIARALSPYLTKETGRIGTSLISIT